MAKIDEDEPGEVHACIPQGCTALVPVPLGDSWPSRELGSPIYAVNFGTLTHKPMHFRNWAQTVAVALCFGALGERKTERHSIRPRPWSTAPHSPTAWMHHATHSRMPFLRTPSSSRQWPNGLVTTCIPNKLAKREASTGGQFLRYWQTPRPHPSHSHCRARREARLWCLAIERANALVPPNPPTGGQSAAMVESAVTLMYTRTYVYMIIIYESRSIWLNTTLVLDNFLSEMCPQHCKSIGTPKKR